MILFFIFQRSFKCTTLPRTRFPRRIIPTITPSANKNQRFMKQSTLPPGCVGRKSVGIGIPETHNATIYELRAFSQVQDVATNTIPTHQHPNDRTPISQKQRFPKQLLAKKRTFVSTVGAITLHGRSPQSMVTREFPHKHEGEVLSAYRLHIRLKYRGVLVRADRSRSTRLWTLERTKVYNSSTCSRLNVSTLHNTTSNTEICEVPQ